MSARQRILEKKILKSVQLIIVTSNKDWNFSLWSNPSFLISLQLCTRKHRTPFKNDTSTGSMPWHWLVTMVTRNKRTSARSMLIHSTVHSSFSWNTSEPLSFLATAFPSGRPRLSLKSRTLTSCDQDAKTSLQVCSSNGKYLTLMLHMLL